MYFFVLSSFALVLLEVCVSQSLDFLNVKSLSVLTVSARRARALGLSVIFFCRTHAPIPTIRQIRYPR